MNAEVSPKMDALFRRLVLVSVLDAEQQDLVVESGISHVYVDPAIGTKDLKKTGLNLAKLSARGRDAKASGFLLEALAARVYLLEFLLRLWIARHTGRALDADDRVTFGDLIGRAELCHLDPELVRRLRALNTHRNKALHGLVTGKLLYEEIADALRQDGSLLGHLAAWLSERFIEEHQELERKTVERLRKVLTKERAEVDADDGQQ